MGNAPRRKHLKKICPVWGTDQRVSEDDTLIAFAPHPMLIWPCTACDDIHDWTLTLDRFDFLQAKGFDILSALAGDADTDIVPVLNPRFHR